jgi:type I restriction enzyme M protein
MFVQTGHFLEEKGTSPTAAITFYGQEKSDTNVNLARMNMAVHGLEGTHIRQGNTCYDRLEHLIGRCHRVMANPPFNVDGVDPARLKHDPRLFTEKRIPGISSKTKAVSNANYLWIQYFYSYLNETGRAGFVMASSATDAGHGERKIRQQIIETGHVDVIIAIGTNFFYTRSLPCTLWFFDKGKPDDKQDKVLMIDARHIYRVVTRKIRDFSDEQLANLTAIVWLHRGQTDRFLDLVGRYLSQLHTAVCTLPAALNQLDSSFTSLHTAAAQLAATAQPTEGQAASNGDSPSLTPATIAAFQQQVADLAADGQAFQQERADLLQELTDCTADIPVRSPAGKMPTAQEQHAARAQLDPFIPRLKAMQKTITVLVREAGRARDTAEKELNGRQATTWDGKTARTALADLEAARDTAAAALKEIINWHSQANWLQSRFPDGVYGDVLGLCKVVSRADIAAHDDSLTPGRYVGVAPLELEDDEDFEERMAEIHIELEDLNQEAFELASTIKTNFEDLGI